MLMTVSPLLVTSVPRSSSGSTAVAGPVYGPHNVT